MSQISEDHAQWHQMYGAFATCNLDCGADEPWVNECRACGQLFEEYPSEPGKVYGDCVDPAACEVIIEAQDAVYAAKQEAEMAAYIAACVGMDPWAVDPASMPPILF